MTHGMGSGRNQAWRNYRKAAVQIRSNQEKGKIWNTWKEEEKREGVDSATYYVRTKNLPFL